MSWSNVMGLLERYASPAASQTGSVEQDFEQVSQAAPQSHLAAGLTEAFRSTQTPPFAQMLSSLFNNSDGQQRAGILNDLLSSAGPGIGAGLLGNLLAGGSSITAEQAQQVPPDRVQQLAEQAERNDPAVVEKVSAFYAQHPSLVKTLGAGSLALIMSHISRNL